MLVRRAWGAPMLQPDIAVTVESQAAFLQRLSLLAPGEAARLTSADFAPVVLEPGHDEEETRCRPVKRCRRQPTLEVQDEV